MYFTWPQPILSSTCCLTLVLFHLEKIYICREECFIIDFGDFKINLLKSHRVIVDGRLWYRSKLWGLKCSWKTPTYTSRRLTFLFNHRISAKMTNDHRKISKLFKTTKEHSIKLIVFTSWVWIMRKMQTSTSKDTIIILTTSAATQ